MEATIFNQIKCYMMYIFEPLKSCTIYLLTCHGHSWTLVASNGLKFLKKMDFLRHRFNWILLHPLEDHLSPRNISSSAEVQVERKVFLKKQFFQKFEAIRGHQSSCMAMICYQMHCTCLRFNLIKYCGLH